jgi:hypothetical protein
MSRSGYSDDCADWQLIQWRGAVASAKRGKRGQALLLEMWRAMQALPEHKLIAGDLEANGAVCALGALGKARGLDMARIDPEDHEAVAAAFGVAHALACEIMWMNDEGSPDDPEARYAAMKKWIEESLLPIEDVQP